MKHLQNQIIIPVTAPDIQQAHQTKEHSPFQVAFQRINPIPGFSGVTHTRRKTPPETDLLLLITPKEIILGPSPEGDRFGMLQTACYLLTGATPNQIRLTRPLDPNQLKPEKTPETMIFQAIHDPT